MSSKRHNYLGIGVLAALVMAFALVLWPVARASAEGAEYSPEIYVNANSTAASQDGTEESPYKSLAAAFKRVDDMFGSADEMANKPVTVYVMSNLIATESARYWDAHVTLTSKNGPWTITRDENFSETHDGNLGGYNGAMIEVGNSGSLTIENLTLDDAGKHMGSRYVQVAPYDQDGDGELEGGSTNIGGEPVNNYDIVQDGIITTYSSDFKITLGEKCQLKNFGGMSAVRVSGGTLIMQSGSSIFDDIDDMKLLRKKGEANDYGYAGAVWIQSGTLDLENGAIIRNTSGHAVYADGVDSSATISGQINAIEADSQAWQGTNGVALHLRNNSGAVLCESGSVSDITGSQGQRGSIVFVEASSFEMKYGSGIRGNNGVFMGVQLAGAAQAEAVINGEITGVQDSAIHMNNGSNSANFTGILKCTIGKDAWIHGNNGGPYGTVTMQTNNGELDVSGRIVDNTSTDHAGICMAHNVGLTTVRLHSGAQISRNYSTGGVAGIKVCAGSLSMEDGVIIDGNASSATDEGAGVFVSQGGHFKMDGGTISNNISIGSWAGVGAELSDFGERQNAQVILGGGAISGNLREATNITPPPAGSSPATAADGRESALSIAGNALNALNYGHLNRFLSVSNDVALDDSRIHFIEDDFYLENPGNDVKLGNTNAACKTKATNNYSSQGLTEVLGSFWFQSGRGAETFTVWDLAITEDKPVFAAIVETGEDGTPSSNSTVSLVPTSDNGNGSISFTIAGASTTGKAVVLLQEGNTSANVLSIVPADLTAYMGGKKGYQYVVEDGEGHIDPSTSIPTPGFKVTLPAQWEINDVIITDNNAHTWHFEPYSSGSTDVYKVVPIEESGGAQVRMEFIDESGKLVTEDTLDINSNLNQVLKMRVYGEGIDEGNVTASCDGQKAIIASGVGTLTVRGTTKTVKYASPSSEPSKGLPGLIVPDGTTFTINDGTTQVTDSAGVALLFDDIIETGGTTDNSNLLKNHAEAKIFANEDGSREYEFKYLDLVDRNNGNVWVKASESVTVCWPLPEGTDSDTEFTVLHFEGLHREMGVEYIGNAIGQSTVKKISCEVVDGHVRFEIGTEGFSPFALVWDRPSGGSVTPPAATHTITASAGEGGSISPSGEVSVRDGADQTFTITPDEGNKVRDVVVDGASVGALGSYTFDDVRGDHAISVTFTRGNAPADPDDTGVSGWFETGDHDAFLHGYDDGTGRFGPEDSMTRGEAAQMFYNMLKDKSRGSVAFDFEDLPEGAWYHEAVATLASHGILLGTSPTTVEPERPITRAEFTAMAMRFSKGDLSGENIFTDVSEGDWYYGVIVGSIKYGWISGYDDGTGRFGPNDNITRAQATIIANRMLGRVPDGVYINARLGELTRFPDVSEGFYAFRDIVEATNSHDYSKDGGFEHWSGLR